ncbi:(2Fe-2S) ferredoxin domain-containing protein [Gammaproteobacteria bacterium AB-CW1]|uniref:(2Fe-2S) ferredoxin domain-containing protein n=1 Tax=Natronospira elongata TaxID=3110268 RepID=A0AAP6MNE8_9GAMM|nr:(2Fe-2S) ferredoxin domain-containing protein [Gammaproteobacteria bacterium AB-CW1]
MSFYQRHAFFCTNQRDNGRACCQDHGASELRRYARERLKEAGVFDAGGIRASAAGCLGRCEEGPVIVVYPEGTWYTYFSREDVDLIIDEHLLGGRIVDSLRI